MKIELDRKPTGSRTGVAPFATGSEKPESDRKFSLIRSNVVSLGSLGRAYVELQQPLEVSEDDQAFTIDLSGNVKKGKLSSFLEKGYYPVAVCVMHDKVPVDGSGQGINVSIGIKDTEPIVTTDLRSFDDRDQAYFFKVTKTGAIEEFVLPNDPEILQALRINLSSK